MYEREEQEAEVDEVRLEKLTLFSGFLGWHKFYMGQDTTGAFYFAIFVLGLAFTLYHPLWVSFELFNRQIDINFGIVILLLPVLASIIEFVLLRRLTIQRLYSYYPTEHEPEPIVIFAQLFFLCLFFIPFFIRILS
jgi:hypothetical protein